MACNNDVTDKLKSNAVGSEALAVNTKRIRQLTKDLRASTDCDAIKMKLGITGDELKELTKDIRAEAKKILEKYLPILKIPTNPLKIIPWVKKLVTGTIMPQLEAYIKLLQQVIGIVQATQELIAAAGEVLPRLEQCAKDTINQEINGALGELRDIEASIQAAVDKIVKEITDEINKAICESGIADLVSSINDAVSLTKQLVNEVNTTASVANAAISNTLSSVNSIGSAISGVTGVPFNVDTSSASAFTTSIEAGHFDTFKNDTQTFIDKAPATNTVAPTISGSAIVGSTLTANVGTWTGDSVTHTYQWYRGDEPIYGSTSSTYVITADDIGKSITCHVDGDNVAGGDKVITAGTATVVASNPTASVAPVITGTAQAGQVLSCSDGTWAGNPTLSFQWQWAHISANIYGATSTTYTLVTEDIGHAITCIVTATSASGNATARCTPTSLVIA